MSAVGVTWYCDIGKCQNEAVCPTPDVAGSCTEHHHLCEIHAGWPDA